MKIDDFLRIVLSLAAVFPAIVLHEIAHGFVALRLGDPTARNLGRLTLNPIAHVDPIGTILVPIVLAVLGGPVFGWAKPVPINPRYFSNPFQGMLYVALAGPSTNVLLGLSTIVMGRLFLLMVPFSAVITSAAFGSNLLRALFYFLGIFSIINFFLAVLNMIPVPPLDGSRVLTYFLPVEGKRFMLSIERYGFILVLGLLYLRVFNGLFDVVIGMIEKLLGQQWIALMNTL
ncbi:site-2 protease family protein [Candidatus Bipolaricaulota bacterium]